MSKVICDPKSVQDILEKGVQEIYPNRAFLEKKLLSGQRLKLYCGFDPSASSLHIGNAILLNKLSEFQALGHEVIFLVGSFTGMIGDPTDKTAARQKLTRKQVLNNAKLYKGQACRYLKFSGNNKARLLYNSQWHDKLSFKNLLEITSNFTVQQMIQRDMFQARIKDEKPIFLHEFLYPVAQGYDSVVMNVDLEIGGNDQMFNMMAGRDLMKAMTGKEKCVLTMKLLSDDDGKKMGKSEGNAVFLTDSPENMYGKVMSWADGVLASAFELTTNLAWEEIKQIQNDLKVGSLNPRDAKMKLAYTITRMNFGEKKAKVAQDYFIKTVQNKEMPDEIKTLRLDLEKVNILELLLQTKLVASKGEARRLIEQKGIKIDEQVIDDVNLEVDLKHGKIIQKGKRGFIKVIGK
jgi:tyrosyl-tRNA synthetase